MLRAIGAVILGYISMFIFIFVTFTIAYLLMGTDRAFQSGSYEVSGLWLGVSFVLGLVAAIVGGFVCASISKGGKAPLALAGVVLVLGLLLALSVVMSPNTNAANTRAANVPNLEAMQNAKQPTWVALLNPLIGAIGVIVGARLKSGSN
jgi:hypothetical protein